MSTVATMYQRSFQCNKHLMNMIDIPESFFHKDDLKKAGFFFINEHCALLPVGWNMKRGEGSDKVLYDEKGRMRGKLHHGVSGSAIELVCRYIPHFEYYENDTKVRGCIIDNSTGRIVSEIWSGSRSSFEAYKVSSWMREYLRKNYPYWEHSTAYWD